MGPLLESIPNAFWARTAMSHKNPIPLALEIGALVLIALSGVKANAQADPNSAPNPYRTVENWAKLPAGRTWGQVISVDIDADGKSIWVVERCGGTSCTKSNLAPVLKFDWNGNLIRSFG